VTVAREPEGGAVTNVLRQVAQLAAPGDMVVVAVVGAQVQIRETLRPVPRRLVDLAASLLAEAAEDLAETSPLKRDVEEALRALRWGEE